jgi:hypothetical protein
VNGIKTETEAGAPAAKLPGAVSSAKPDLGPPLDL